MTRLDLQIKIEGISLRLPGINRLVVRSRNMKKQELDRFAAKLTQTVRQPSMELVMLKRHWPDVQRRFDKERQQLDRKIPKDDPIRQSVDLLAPLNEIDAERSHTRALAYLLDPLQDHGLKTAVLTALLEQAKAVALLQKGKKAVLSSAAVLRVLRLLAIKGVNVSVTPEYRYDIEGTTKRSNACPDIWIVLRTDRNAALVVIENKINACESTGQLKWYERKAREWCKAEKGRGTTLLLFLAYDQDEVTSSDTDDWQVISYLDLAAALRKVWKSKSRAAGRSWLSLYIASVTRGLLGLDIASSAGADLADIKHYIGEVQ